MYFSESFVTAIIIGALIMISAATITLVVLVIGDIRNKRIW